MAQVRADAVRSDIGPVVIDVDVVGRLRTEGRYVLLRYIGPGIDVKQVLDQLCSQGAVENVRKPGRTVAVEVSRALQLVIGSQLKPRPIGRYGKSR